MSVRSELIQGYKLNNPMRWLWRWGCLPCNSFNLHATILYYTMQYSYIIFSSTTLCTIATYARIQMEKLECIPFSRFIFCMFISMYSGWMTDWESRWCCHYLLILQSKFADAFACIFCYCAVKVLLLIGFCIFCYQYLLLAHSTHA